VASVLPVVAFVHLIPEHRCSWILDKSVVVNDDVRVLDIQSQTGIGMRL
jgi:hypothetical protein